MTKTAANTVVAPVTPGSFEARPLTGDLIRSQVGEAIEAMAGAFYEPQLRRIADNGRAYPNDATLPEGVEDTGELIVTNRFGYVQSQIVDCICWKLETMLEAATKRVADETAAIKVMVRNLDRGRGDALMIERKADFLDQLEEQVAMLQVAFDQAKTARLEQLGDEYEDKAARAERQAALAKARAEQPTNDRLARFR